MHKRTEWKHKRDQACKRQDNKPDREQKSSKMWVEVHEIKVIFTLIGVIVELSLSLSLKKLQNSSTQQSAGKFVMISALVRDSGSVITRLHVLIPLMKEWKTCDAAVHGTGGWESTATCTSAATAT